MSDDPIVELTLNSDVKPFSLGFRIVGVEVTQAVQYFRSSSHLTDAADRSSDNAVTLIAKKPAWVRVYVRSGLFQEKVVNVTGSIEVKRRKFGFLYVHETTLAPQPPGIMTAHKKPIYAAERGILASTLNFILPADVMCGHLRLVVNVNAPGNFSDNFTLDLDVTLQQTLRVAGIMVGYDGPANSNPNPPNLTLPAPNLADLQTTAAWTLSTFPVRSTATYHNAGTITWNLPLTDQPNCPGCCTPNWLALNAAVQAQKVADGNKSNFLYYGLMAAGIPMGPVIGCNTGGAGVSTGGNGNGITMAHELGHACGLPHAPCGTPGDPNYPAYEPYDPANTPNASIGEYGLDISNGNIKRPSLFKDVMSYCGPDWISLYNYGRLTNNAKLAPVHVCMDEPWWFDIQAEDPFWLPEEWIPGPSSEPAWRKRVMDPEPVISIIGVVHSEDEIEIKSLVRLTTLREVRDGKPTDLIAELVGPEGRVISKAPLFDLRDQSHGGCGCSGSETGSRYPFLFQTFVPDAGPGAVLRIRRGDKELWTRRAPSTEPRVDNFNARLQEGDQLSVGWRFRSSSELEPEVWLQWSKDQGKTWNGLATGLRGESATIDAAGLPSGQVVVRLLASDGFFTAESKPVTLEVSPRPPAVSILAPREGQTLIAGGTMRLWGAVLGSDGQPVKGEKARWLLDGKEAGEGLDVFAIAPPEGEHDLVLTVTVDDEKAERTVRFKTIKLPDERE